MASNLEIIPPGEHVIAHGGRRLSFDQTFVRQSMTDEPDDEAELRYGLLAAGCFKKR